MSNNAAKKSKDGKKILKEKQGKGQKTCELVIETPLGFKVKLNENEKLSIGEVKVKFLKEFKANPKFTQSKIYKKSVIPKSPAHHLALVWVEGENTLFLNEDKMTIADLLKKMGKKHKKDTAINLKISKFMSINPLSTVFQQGYVPTVDKELGTNVKMNVSPDNDEVKPVGIKNPIGNNVCYQNSILQLVSSNTLPMRKFFVNFQVPKDLLGHEDTQIILQYQKFLAKTNQGTTVDNSDFAEFIWDFQFVRKTQQDAQEFLLNKLLAPLQKGVLVCALKEEPATYTDAKSKVEGYQKTFDKAFKKLEKNEEYIQLKKDEKALGPEHAMKEKKLKQLYAVRKKIHEVGLPITGKESEKMDKLKDKLDTEVAKLTKPFIGPISGKYTTFLECKSCKQTATKKGTPFSNLQLALDDERVKSMNDSLGLWFKKEELGHDTKCRLCGEYGKVAKHHEFTHMPDNLFVSLTRMAGDSKVGTKLEYYESWDLSKFKKSQISDKKVKYRLVGICNHSGKSAKRGHYTAFVKETTGTWWDCNDSSIANIANIETKLSNTSEPYILVYQKVKDIVE